jgi:hypothetical protein
VRSSFSNIGCGTIDLIRAAVPHCGQATHVAITDGTARAESIMPVSSRVALMDALSIDQRVLIFWIRLRHTASQFPIDGHEATAAAGRSSAIFFAWPVQADQKARSGGLRSTGWAKDQAQPGDH